ncbi:haloacid dehalogenase [Shewanella sp. c952]|uniref:haloacid dehalogenase type II n=1 Tax=Shewanella sp. c952 TaxID=2815913 RepID=UPI001BBF9CF0|nr:haloacid dehalogenase type II [Shewanella sp. c952]GIU19074.1 haloacid dehalogenase [Shewanella sp. c952]
MKLNLSAIVLIGVTLMSSTTIAAESVKQPPRELPKVIFFDVNETLLDLGNVALSVTKALDGRDDLVASWFTTMLHYSLVSNAIDDYHHFSDIGVAALQLVAQQHHIALTQAEAKQAIQVPFGDLQPHQDVIQGLKRLKAMGVKLVTLTNSSDAGIKSQLQNAKLTQYFDKSLTVQSVQIFKPDLRVYQWALEQMDVDAKQSMLVAAHAWDIAGASKAGMQTAFIQRPGKYQFELFEKADYVASDILSLAEQLSARKKP